MDKSKQETIEEIEKLLRKLKTIKRKIYCSKYYQENKERILNHIKSIKRDKANILSEKCNFQIEQKQIVIDFE
jgi:hypothetical protein